MTKRWKRVLIAGGLLVAVGSAAFIGGGLFAGLFFNKTIAAPPGSIEVD